MIKHVMLFWFKSGTEQSDKDQVLNGITNFVEIPAVQQVALEENTTFPDSSAPFTHTAILTFLDEEGRDAFFVDDRHRSLREWALKFFGDLKTMSVRDDAELERLAAILRTAEDQRQPVRPLTEQLPGFSVKDAYRVQQLNVIRKVRAGGVVVGQKVGLTAVVMQQQLGVDEPDYGVLFADMMVADGEPMPISAMIQPRVEAEVAFIMKHDLRGPGVTDDDALAAVEGAIPVIEVIDSRISDWKIKLPDTVADNASCARVVRGSRVTPVDALDLAGIELSLSVDGVVVSTGVGAAVLGNPIRGVVWLANKLGELGGSLKAGDLVLAGALHASLPVTAGAVVRAEFTEIGTVTAAFSD
ncbi:fumarylacetoacetate hydrolase family protein [Arthrobacter sp. MI7-26]|uniref:fumarylacetoacetate hydrolase family protein n=1 Tax=Arthrobacter sp. MI7-26 TaxID=2993653 RepID=UPI0022495B76|nr:fumarylacetoacetate hydrolase family protein [Arthrobacter sp. MI7-26]MCX2748092.1 fumarylacetoacetate hydrolase family protein [Arthrobacter sp. MI7-26]